MEEQRERGDFTATGESRPSGPLVLVLTSPRQLLPGAQPQATRTAPQVLSNEVWSTGTRE